MTDLELYQITSFVKRPGMYLGNHEIKSIDGFLLGYSMAKNNRQGFQRGLVKYIFKNYNHIEPIAKMEKGNVHLLIYKLKKYLN